jgi:MFS superfamily sulfate permease-like transporter
LIVVIVGAVQTLGQGDAIAGYRYTLAAIMLAGALQIVLGIYRAGRFSACFPAAVVHGLLAAIGLIIIAKQSHVMLGISAEPGSIFSTIAQIPHSMLHPEPKIAFIGLTGLAILIGWPRVKHSKLQLIPAPIIVLLAGIILGRLFGLQHDLSGANSPGTTSQFLVTIPDQISDYFYLPDFSKFFTLQFWLAVISICFVGSLETLMITIAVDKLDPYKRRSDLDREITAIGYGNALAAFFGGLPMIAEIVRSSANINYGGKTGWANFFHGLIFLAVVVLFTNLIQNIPLASLAALLVYTGYQLASPKTFRRVLDIGVEQFCLFTITIVGVLATDLLVGVAIGMTVKLGIHIVRGVWLDNLFKIHFTLEQTGFDTVVVKLHGSALFSNFLPLKEALENLENGKTIIFDFSNGYLIDHTVMEFIQDFSNDYTAQGGSCRNVGHALEKFSDHALAARLMTEDDRNK